MLEWLKVRLDVGCDKRLVYEYRIEPPSHLSEKIQRARSYCLQSFEHDWYKKESSGGDKNTWVPSERPSIIIIIIERRDFGGIISKKS